MHNPDNQISLKLTPDTTHAHCLLIMQQALNTSHALASLVALQSFVVAMAQAADIESAAFRVIKGIINGHIANLRTELLSEQSSALTAALLATDCTAITRIHTDTSRNAFWQTTQTATLKLDEAERSRISAWAKIWHDEAKSRALAASGYPDALNFQKAGVSPQEYAAMTDLNNCLQNTK